MLQELMQIIQQQGQQHVVDNQDVPNEHNEAVMQQASSSIMSGLQNVISSGNLSQLTSLLQGGSASDNPAVSNISNDFINNITQKFGINPETASNLAGKFIPQILDNFRDKAVSGGAAGVFNLENMMGMLKGGDMQSTINSLGSQFGLDKDKDGDIDFKDITKMFGK